MEKADAATKLMKIQSLGTKKIGNRSAISGKLCFRIFFCRVDVLAYRRTKIPIFFGAYLCGGSGRV